jgi:glycosyltransferase involved in cell wall biosynthesis
MTNATTVAHLVISLQHGGLEQCALQWCQARNKKRPNSTIIICLDQNGPLAETLPRDQVIALNANRSRFPWDMKAVFELRKLLASRKIEVIHSHNTSARQYACLACSNAKTRHIYTDHGTNPHLKGVANHLRALFMKRHTDVMTAVSSEAARGLSKAERIATESISVIKNGISIEAMRGSRVSLRKQWSIEEDTFVIGYVGRLSTEKGVDRLITAFAKLSQTTKLNMPIQLTLIGDGPTRNDLEALSRQLGISDYVKFLGAQPNARNLMCGFDLFILPSHSEGLPLSLLEAMAESIPVAATDVGECATVLNQNQFGILLPKHESKWPDALAQLINEIRTGKSNNKVIGAREHIEQHYSITQTIEHYETLYRND